jgi:hypothetical protein
MACTWPRQRGSDGSRGRSPYPHQSRPDPNGVIAEIQDAARANRFEELRKLEDGLAAFGEDALPEIRKALLEGTPGNDGMVELWNSGSMHPRAKLHLLAAAARRIREL